MSSEPLPSRRGDSSFGGSLQLLDAEKVFTLLVRSVKDYGIFMLDPSGRIVTWNEGAARIEGYPEEEILGKHFSIFYTDEAKLANRPTHELEIAEREGRYEEEGLRVRKDGTTFWANVVLTAVRDGSKLVGFAKIVQDLTERKRAEVQRRKAEKAEEHFRLMIASVKDYAIFMLDPEGNVLTWNEGAMRIQGYKAEEIIGQHFSKFYSEELRQINHPQHELEIAKREGRYEEEGWRVRKDGTTFWANVVITALFDHGELVGFAKVTRDLTERRRTQQAAEETARLIEETNEELHRLAYVVSHELQAPIATISRYCNLLTVRYKDVLGRDAHEFLEKMTYSSKLVGRMVDDLWTYARVSQRNAIHDNVYTRHCVTDAMDEIGENRDVEVDIGELPSIEANRTQLTFVFKELIKNAIRYHSAEPVRVAIDSKPHQEGFLFSVKDNGVGIDKIHSVEVFQLFHRLRGGPEPTATGMGLAMCKKIVQLHGGHIWYEANETGGTTFFFWLPSRYKEPSEQSWKPGLYFKESD